MVRGQSGHTRTPSPLFEPAHEWFSQYSLHWSVDRLKCVAGSPVRVWHSPGTLARHSLNAPYRVSPASAVETRMYKSVGFKDICLAATFQI